MNMEVLMQYMSYILTGIGVLAFLVSAIVQTIKEMPELKKVQTNAVALITSLILTPASVIVLCTYYKIVIEWYYIFASFIAAFIVYLVSTGGWERVTEMWNRNAYKKKKNCTGARKESKMSKTAAGLVAFAKSKLGTPYIYGAKGTVMSLSRIRALRKQYGSNCVWTSDDSKAGKVCVDCSGLISWYTGTIRGSGQYKSTAVEVLPISQRTNDHIGWAVWMKGHIGIYLGNDQYIAADGSAYGVRIAKLSQNRFTHLLKLCDIDYGQGTTSGPKETIKPSGGYYNAGVDFTYAVRAGGKTYPAVTNLADYAGVRGIPITDIAIKCSVGNIKYRVHVAANKKKGIAGRWLPYVSGYNWKDSNNGYAGNGLPVDAIEIIYTAPNGSTQKAQYRVSPVNRNYYSWQYNNETGGGQDGYAGAFGVLIDRFQLF